MPRQVLVPGAKCNKCDFVLIGEDALDLIVPHEKIRVTRMPSLDMLLIKTNLIRREPFGDVPVYTVISDTGEINQNHQALYTWRDYRRCSLNEVRGSSWTDNKRNVSAYGTHGVGGIFDVVLHVRPEEWVPGEFERLGVDLKDRYPALYRGVKFKQKVPRLPVSP